MARATTVLVVDDDPGILEMVADVLDLEGYRVLQAVGAATLEIAHHEQPQIILLDVNMPGMDGVEVSQQLLNDPATARIPIIAMTALRADAIRTGMRADDWLRKPFDIKDLVQLVARWCGKR